jgi:uncharacterized membrane protein YedE/YeeE
MPTSLILPRSSAFHASSLVSGFLFALGLGISGMTDPRNIIGFLDITGDWQPALLFVMASAILVYTIAGSVSKRLSRPLLAPNWSELPAPGPDLPWRARVGNLIFGAGWGLAGYCPGPALTSLPAFQLSTWIFTGSMISGFLAWEFLALRVKKTK